MSILVTGGCGYIGSHMVYELIDAGESVVVLDNLTTGFHWAIPGDARLVVGDIGDEGLVKELVRKHDVEAIIHFAGSIVVPESVADPLGYYLNNTVKSRALIAAAVASGVKSFIFSSTAAVYGAPREMPVRETTHLEPMSPYGSSKLMTEIMLRDTSLAHDFRHVALRYFNAAGAVDTALIGESHDPETYLIPLAIAAALGQAPPLRVFGSDYATADGTCVRDYIHVNDLALAHCRALELLADESVFQGNIEQSAGRGLALNLGTANGASVKQVIAEVEAVVGKPVPLQYVDRRAGDPAELVADYGYAKEILGWLPAYDLRRIVETAFNWEQKRSY